MKPTRFFRAAVLVSLTSLLVAGAADSSSASDMAVPTASGRRLLAQEGSGTVDPELLAGIKARSIGPAGMSGRVTAIDVVHSDPKTIYVGAASGGVWKTEDAGMTWTPVFDDQPVHSIGDIEIFQASPDVVWVGTGEGNPRNSISVGNGIYKSIDGGQTWEHLGLEKTEHIHRIVLHPTDPDIAYVAALGQAWGENEERGVFKTTDGGETWEKILYVDEKTGATELVMDPVNPEKLIAAMWEFRRWPFFFKSGGPGSGLYASYDGGDSWKKYGVEDGMPHGELGRIGVAISLSDPNVVYALVEAEKSALLRSDDGGRRWRTVNDDNDIADRPFYYGNIRVDPEIPDRVYNVASVVRVSVDGGSSFDVLVPFMAAHPDHHAFWIHPENPDFILDGNDGGVAISNDRGENWQFVRNLPLSQFYHVGVDMDVPYNVYGGLQDNGSWRGPNAVWEGGFGPGFIRNFHWQAVYFGDGFDTQVVPGETEVGYAMAQGGNLVRWNMRTGEIKMVFPDELETAEEPGNTELRFNWNAGLAVDPHDPDAVYYGSQHLHRSTDRGDTWQVISPDLTSDNPEWQQQADSGGLTPDVTGAENYTTIIAIAPSPVEQAVIWVGTDDGRLHVTRDGGESWTSLEGNLPGVPENTWIPHVEPSQFDPAGAFVVLDDHRRSNWTPYVFRTDDYGATWTSLATDNIDGYALVIDQDPVDENLLFLGTEFGLYFSQDGGSSWMKWTHGLPTASVMDLLVHPRDHDLVIATHGRGIYIIDDIRPLRSASMEVLAEPLHLFEIPPAQQYSQFFPPGGLFSGQGEYHGENQPYGAMLTYSVHPQKDESEGAEEAPSGPPAGAPSPETIAMAEMMGMAPPSGGPQVDITITDAAGGKIRSMRGPAAPGVNRAVWNLRRDNFRQPPGGGDPMMEMLSGGGPEVPAGTYGVKVSFGDQEVEGTIEILADPRSSVSDADRRAKWAAIQEAGDLQERLADAVVRMIEASSDIDVITKKAQAALQRERESAGAEAGAAGPGGGAGEQSPYTQLVRTGSEIKRKLAELEGRLRTSPDSKGIVAQEDAMTHLSEALTRLTSSWDAPSSTDDAYLRQARTRIDAILADVEALFAGEISDYRDLTRRAGVELLGEKD
jgi:photosystem II stability/assembly factor-like uncharacterized protein